MPKPTIAAINGVAVGIGITQVLPFDIRIASQDAHIGFVFVKMGLVPELASSHLLTQLAGAGRALEWCLTGRMIPASEAKESGLVSEVVPADTLLDRALALGEELSSQSLDAIRLIKALLRQNAHEANLGEVQRREGEALREAYASPEHHEAVKAFLEKRKPELPRSVVHRSAPPAVREPDEASDQKTRAPQQDLVRGGEAEGGPARRREAVRPRARDTLDWVTRAAHAPGG
jgi:enoyl-CoA hydratase/carnithine racemase